MYERTKKYEYFSEDYEMTVRRIRLIYVSYPYC